MAVLISPEMEGDALESKAPKPNLNNLLNFLGYIISLATSYMGGVAGWFGGTPNIELGSTYQTLITPRASCLGYVWAAIFLLEGFFAMTQLLPRYRAQPLVQDGVGSIFFFVVTTQMAWTITFGFEMMIPAFISMFALLISLLIIVNRQWAVVKVETAAEERQKDLAAQPPGLSYWLLRFPFAIHAGWIAVVTPLMLSVVLVKEGETMFIYVRIELKFGLIFVFLFLRR